MIVIGNAWRNGGDANLVTAEDVFGEYDVKPDERAGVSILLAQYDYADYSGDSFVLFEKDGKLYEVNGGHCSCDGLEGQWKPEEVVVEELLKRPSLESIRQQIAAVLQR